MKTGYESVIFGCALFAFLVIIAATAAVWLHRRQMCKLMEQIDQMLDAAIEGQFRESHFDESLLSSVETKLAHYLSSTEVSAEQVKKEKEKIKELLGDISHQTKTPVANLLLYSQLLEEQIKMQKKKENTEVWDTMISSVNAIQMQAEKLKFLIESLVKTSRLETGVLSIRPGEHDVKELINNAAAQVCPKAKARGITVETEILEKPSGTMHFDLKWTVEALYNILDNAVKYSHEGKVVWVRAYSYSMFYRIDVIDEGISIPENEQEKVFQRFFRGAQVSEQEGVGIGLYLTRQIVSSQGGYLKLSSEQHGKTTVSMFLPIK